mmetsp:Transcript_38313/g.90621  ORF Transcript_38313/g.90621 Transcript_38313/m.90621 type:complete len:228 (-) Transcript_38313:81-764(-)|eukprot:CAMPEP_0180141784 /NCGR_PEP_ID=MMETSP0986-20121125/15144_1 /TAXON_ID=697907 /ORGANISM="non described non described, Strain CCMP2293" /LENGTH=227 /DNA_ID=CAMNT_0022084763 /DNA_START=41 /DNA_END=724 /DNA_ORIENTATION=+
MNIFRFSADMLHLLSFFVLLFRMRSQRSCRGVSLKTQLLFLIVFSCRYLDLFFSFISIYNTLMKVLFISATATTVYWILEKYKTSYDLENDKFHGDGSFFGHFPPHGVLGFIILPCLLLSLVWNEGYEPFEILWAFSIYLEAVAILPQLFMLQKTKEGEAFTLLYIFCVGAYRGLYLINWIYRYFTEPHYWQPLVWTAGVVQTLLYADFFYYYIVAVKEGSKFQLPG